MGGVDHEHTLAHEIGHALGFSHPFDGGYNNIGTLSDSVDNSLTIMTYDSVPRLLGINPLPIDILAMEFLYGGSNEANLGESIYRLDHDQFFSAQTSNHKYVVSDARMSIVDDGGVEPLM